MPFRMTGTGKMKEKRSPISKRRVITYSPSTDLSRRTKPLKAKFQSTQYLHTGDVPKGKSIPNNPRVTFICPKDGQSFSPKFIRNPLRHKGHVAGYV